MFSGLLLRFLPAAILPWLIPAGLGALIAGSGFTAWILEWMDWQTAVIWGLTAAAILWVVMTANPYARFIIPVILCVAMFFRGAHYGVEKGEAQRLALIEAHDAEVVRIHNSYKKASDDEAARQRKVIAEQAEDAKNQKLIWNAERDNLKAQLKQLQIEASNAPQAKRPSLDADAIQRINKLRHTPKGARRSVRNKTPVRRLTPVGKATVPKAAFAPD